jgi:TPR repeat protein
VAAGAAAAAEPTPRVRVQEPPPAAPMDAGLITRRLDRDEVAALVKRGEDFMMSGEIASARLVLRRAAEAGDVRAALALAGTFDAIPLAKLGLERAADAAMARLWYERAKQFGSAEASQRLQQLANTVP